MRVNQITQSSYDIYKVYTPASAEYKENRMPRVGDVQEFSDGRRFRFVSTAVNVAAGQLVGRAAVALLDDKFTAASAGSYEVEIEVASVTANQYAGGVLVVANSAGREVSYTINANTASSATNKVTLTLASPLKAAILAAEDAYLIPPLYEKVVLGAANVVAVGVAMGKSTAHTATETQYLWVQTKGPGQVEVKTDTNIAVTTGLIPGADGGVIVATATGGQIAIALGTGVAGTSVPCLLNIE
jgi:hypothetical protein